MINSTATTSEIVKAFPNIKWVMVNNEIYDLTNFQHPGGNFIIEQCVGREVGRFFFGAYGLESTKLTPYAHSQSALDILPQYYVGVVQAESILVP